MIYVLTGSNYYAVQSRLKDLVNEAGVSLVQPSLYDLTLSDLSVLLLGENLFSNDQILILKGLSERKDIYEPALELLIKNKDVKNIILIENSLDKRTTAYKKLSANAKIEDYQEYNDRDFGALSKWLHSYVKKRGISISSTILDELVNRVGFSQEQLATAADRLILMDGFTQKGIELYIPKTPSRFSFDLFSTALKKDLKKLDETLGSLKQTQDPYMLMGLLISQLIQVVALTNSNSSDNVAKDLGVSPYALNNLRREVKLTSNQAKKALEIFYDADASLKSKGTAPWQAIEVALKRLTRI